MKWNAPPAVSRRRGTGSILIRVLGVKVLGVKVSGIKVWVVKFALPGGTGHAVEGKFPFWLKSKGTVYIWASLYTRDKVLT